MNRSVITPFDLPVGTEPGWELRNTEDTDAQKSVSERCGNNLSVVVV